MLWPYFVFYALSSLVLALINHCNSKAITLNDPEMISTNITPSHSITCLLSKGHSAELLHVSSAVITPSDTQSNKTALFSHAHKHRAPFWGLWVWIWCSQPPSKAGRGRMFFYTGEIMKVQEVNWPAEAHPAGKCWSQDRDLGSLAPESSGMKLVPPSPAPTGPFSWEQRQIHGIL